MQVTGDEEDSAQALVYLVLISLLLSDEAFQELSELSVALKVVETGCEVLQKRDCTLPKVDQIFEYMLKGLSTQEAAQFQPSLHQASKTRVKERRLMIVSGLLLFLGDPEEFNAKAPEESPIFAFPGKVAKSAWDIFMCMFHVKKGEDVVNENNNSSKETQESEALGKKSKEDELRQCCTQRGGRRTGWQGQMQS